MTETLWSYYVWGDILEQLAAERIRLYFCYSAVLLLAFLAGSLIFEGLGSTTEAETASAENIPVVVIDAGHGGEDGGAVANGIVEKDVNLEIARQLRDMLELSGFRVRMIREDDRSVCDEGADTIREKKVSDMKNRLKTAGSDSRNILISIHQNKFRDSKYSGAQIFYASKDPGSKELAGCVRSAVTGLLQPENKREIKPEDNAYLLKNAVVPSIIVECGFISNPEEAALLRDKEYQKKLAFSVLCGFLDYQKNKRGR